MQARANTAAGTLPMIRMVRLRKAVEENPAEEASEHEWAEYNLPFALLTGLSGDGEDNLAFFGLGTERDDEPTDGST